MRSLIILEVEHGEDTDAVQRIVDRVRLDIEQANIYRAMQGGTMIDLTNYTVRVDLPDCFVLDSEDSMEADIAAGRVCGDHERPTPCIECM